MLNLISVYIGYFNMRTEPYVFTWAVLTFILNLISVNRAVLTCILNLISVYIGCTDMYIEPYKCLSGLY